MTMAERLLYLSRDLAERFPNSLTAKRRAVSTAYYAAFHAIAYLCARELLPDAGTQSFEFERVYRGLEHGSLKGEFNNPPLKGNKTFQQLGALILKLQRARHDADYLPSRNLYSKQSCLELIDDAAEALRLLDKLSVSERRTLAAALLFRKRQG